MAYAHVVRARFVMTITNRMLQFLIYLDDDTTPTNYLPVREIDTTFEISLDTSAATGLDWRFAISGPNKPGDAITFGSPAPLPNYVVRTQTDQAGNLDGTRLYLDAPWSKFKMSQHKPTRDDHKFTVGILLSQPGGESLKIFVDPDVKNPPPVGGFIGAAPVPFSIEPA